MSHDINKVNELIKLVMANLVMYKISLDFQNLIYNK